MIRSIGAIVAGYLVFAVSTAVLFTASGQDPHVMPGPKFLLVSIAYGAGFSALAGYLAARFAPARPLLHAMVVAAIIGLIAVASLIVERNAGSIWSEIVVIAFLSPSTLLGGSIRARRPL